MQSYLVRKRTDKFHKRNKLHHRFESLYRKEQGEIHGWRKHQLCCHEIIRKIRLECKVCSLRHQSKFQLWNQNHFCWVQMKESCSLLFLRNLIHHTQSYLSLTLISIWRIHFYFSQSCFWSISKNLFEVFLVLYFLFWTYHSLTHKNYGMDLYIFVNRWHRKYIRKKIWERLWWKKKDKGSEGGQLAQI